MLKGSNYRSKKRTRVNVFLEDGTHLDGHFHCSIEERISDLLNDSRQFIPFETMNNEFILLRKNHIARIIGREEFSETEISRNPYVLLGVSKDASKEKVRHAYHEKVRAYHPDRIISLDLPADMMNYANDMLSRINAAYDTVLQDFDFAEEIERQRRA